MKQHKLTLLGGSPDELRVPVEILLDAISALLEGARQATRFVLEGQSAREGPCPAWLDAACRVEVTGLTPGSAVVALEAPTLADAVPDRFATGRQLPLFTEPPQQVDASSSAVDLFADVLRSVLADDPDSVVADRPLLETCVRFARAARGGLDGIQLDGAGQSGSALVLRREDMGRIERLRDQTPPPKAVRVTGTLDTISASKLDVVLVQSDGTPVPARLEAHDGERLKQLFGTRVVVSGIAQFRPSGKVLTIDVEHIEPAREADAMFERPPTAKVARQPVVVSMPQDEATGVSAFFGTWPGDESDSELLDALEAIR